MNAVQRMAKDGVAPIRMTFDENAGDFETCHRGWKCGQALCAGTLDQVVDVSKAKVIEVTPKRRPGRNHIKIERSIHAGAMTIDGDYTIMYQNTVSVGNVWISRGYNYVRIDILEESE